MSYYQQNRLCISSRTILSKILAQIIVTNQIIESYRQAISNIPYCDSISLFRFLDKQEKGYLCEKDFQFIVGTSHRKLLTYAFTWIDHLKIGQISRLQFSVFLLPRQDLQLREMMAQRLEHAEISSSNKQTIDLQIKMLSKLLTEIMNCQMKLIDLRYKLLQQKDYSLEAIVCTLDSNNHSWICSDDLSKFMASYGYDIPKRQIQKLFQTINYTQNGKIHLQEIEWMVEGFQTKENTYLKKIKRANNKKVKQKFKDIKENFKRYLSQPKGKQNAVEQKFKKILQKKKKILKKQGQLQRNSSRKQRKSMSWLQKQLNLERQQKRRDKSRRNQSIQILNQSSQLQKQLGNLMNRNNEIELQSERLHRLRNRLIIQEDMQNHQELALANRDINAFKNLYQQPPPQPHIPKVSNQSYRHYHLPFRTYRQDYINRNAEVLQLQLADELFRNKQKQDKYLMKTTNNRMIHQRSSRRRRMGNSKVNASDYGQRKGFSVVFEHIGRQLLQEKPPTIINEMNEQFFTMQKPLKIESQQISIRQAQ